MMRRLWLSVLLLCGSALIQADDAWPLLPEAARHWQTQPQTPQQRLLWGSFTYHYLNQDYRAALNVLPPLRAQLSAEHQGHADLLETSLLLALGLNEAAEQLYMNWQQQGVSAPAQSWFYLARRWFAAGYYEQASEAVTQALSSRPALAEPYRQEALFMEVSSQLEAGLQTAAQRTLALMQGNDLWAGLARHNLLLSYILNDAPLADIRQLLSSSLPLLPGSAEGQALKDKMLLLGGIHALENGRYAEAESWLRAVSLNSPYSAPALLQFGWARLQQQQYQPALQPWRLLQQRFQPWHPAVIESVLGVPYTLEQMQANTQALKGYERVDQHLQGMLDELQYWQQPAQLQQWLQDQLTTAPELTPLDHHVSGLLVTPGFRHQLQQWRESQTLQQEIRQQQQRLQWWQGALHNRRAAFARANGASRLQQAEQQLQQAEQRMERLQQRLDAEEQQLFAYASGHEAAQVQALERVVAHIRSLQRINTPTRDLSLYQQRWRRSRGVLLWNLYQQQPQRRHQVRQHWWQLQQQVGQLQQQLHNSRLALQWSKNRGQGLDPRIATLQQQYRDAQRQLQQLQQRQKAQLQQQLQTHLQQLQAQLQDYQAQARLAIARLYDNALQQHIHASAESPDRPTEERP